ncbi:ArnT family glycosyltransferase [Haloarcula nitratireducens]|uniref:Glycosyltransferase family 39 protein n=1 Tax=Haloarcula nitratireducens TaxID=2487749 RepID=A0AAW4P8S1_9EURY|nr:glycosyltransferase family 39 protein [Halomicroarcula nitratireducens]MBX0294146.1 glycosyltransferase family 39 protein [Halomicroarcula nitratireducens]
MLERIRRSEWIAAVALAALGAVVVAVVSTQLFPYHSLNHDEGVYLQQAAMLLEGRLFLQSPVEGAFRPWFFVESDRGMYSKYSPVAPALFALGKLLGGYRVALVGIAAGNLLLVVGVVREVFDYRTGLLAGAFVLASPLFLIDSAVFLPYAPTTLLNLAFAYAYLRADRAADGRRWAALAGAAVGLAFFSRPYTSVLFAAPFIAHALWTLATRWRTALPRQAIIAVLGSAGVALALGYNAVVTGSPWVFPYQAFAPEDGLGFGHRELLGHEIVYTPELALRANRLVLELFFTEWVAGGLLGTALAVVGLAYAARAGVEPRRAVLAGLFVSIAAGNVYFWGNFNILGNLDVAGDGLVSALGPYYHFDLLLPTAAFAARGAVGGYESVGRALGSRLGERPLRVTLAALVLVSAAALGGVTAGNLADPVEDNAEVTRTYEDAYEPFEGGPPANSLVLLPDPYGNWLNHPFQYLRNDPGYDGRAVYAVDDRPFAVTDAFPDRRVYRYVYRGAWVPPDGSPDAARLQRVRDVSGEQVRLDATVGVPKGAIGVTVRVATDDGSAYYVVPDAGETADLSLTVEDGGVAVAGDPRPVRDTTLAVAGRDTVRVTVFVDYAGGGGFAYRLDLPVDADGEGVRALTPRVEWCRNARACGGAAAYIPEAVPDGVSVGTNLTASERKR